MSAVVKRGQQVMTYFAVLRLTKAMVAAKAGACQPERLKKHLRRVQGSMQVLLVLL